MKTKNLLILAIAWTLLFWVTSAASDFMHYETVDGIGTITICDFNDSSKCITMMDMNLWASKSGTICSSADTWACGNHYQWGNNYGFKIWCFTYWCSDDVTSWSTNILATWSTDFNHVWYNIWTAFIKWTSSSNGDYWDDNTPMNHSWLRWWEKDSEWNNRWYDLEHNVAFDVQNRRWPCPEWYHVPSAWERWTLLKYWVANYTGSTLDAIVLTWTYPLQKFTNTTGVTQFQVDFKIPIAGERFYESAQVFYIGTWGHYWTSSPIIGKDSVRMFRLVYHSLDFTTNWRAAGQSVRCFKNDSLVFPDYVSLIDDNNFIVTVWWEIYTWLDEIMEVTTNNIEEETIEEKPVVWEVSVSFWENVSAKFNKLVQVNVPVSNNERVIVKVKHAWSDEYNFDWLTTNRNASCNDNWRVANNADKYNWEIINVVDWFATIYTCEASSFIALWVEDWWEPQVVVNIADFNEWRNTCTWDNYVFNNIVAWPTTVTWNLVKTFQCAFWEAGGKAVTIQLSWDLEDWNGNTISSWNVKIKNSVWTATPSNVQSWTTAITTYTPLNQIVTLFNKTAWVIWRAEWSWVDIEITVLWWTPDGTYNWTLVLTY